MSEFRFEWQDITDAPGSITCAMSHYGKPVVDITVTDYGETIIHRIGPEQARAIAGALVKAAQHIDPLPATTPNPALTPDQLT